MSKYIYLKEYTRSGFKYSSIIILIPQIGSHKQVYIWVHPEYTRVRAKTQVRATEIGFRLWIAIENEYILEYLLWSIYSSIYSDFMNDSLCSYVHLPLLYLPPPIICPIYVHRMYFYISLLYNMLARHKRQFVHVMNKR